MEYGWLHVGRFQINGLYFIVDVKLATILTHLVAELPHLQVKLSGLRQVKKNK